MFTALLLVVFVAAVLAAPDLNVTLTSQSFADTVANTLNCFDSLSCLDDTGGPNEVRSVHQFSTKIVNDGDVDVILGTLPNASLFTTSECQDDIDVSLNVTITYKVYDNATNDEILEIPAKQIHVCLHDHNCPLGTTRQYACDNEQGLSVGCNVVYSVGTHCQFLDWTNITDGDVPYKICAELTTNIDIGDVNPDNDVSCIVTTKNELLEATQTQQATQIAAIIAGAFVCICCCICICCAGYYGGRKAFGKSNAKVPNNYQQLSRQYKTTTSPLVSSLRKR